MRLRLPQPTHHDWWAVNAYTSKTSGALPPTWHETHAQALAHVARLRLNNPGATIHACIYPLRPQEIHP